MHFDPDLLKNKTKDDETIDIWYRSEKHDHENILKSLKVDSEWYKKHYRSLSKKKLILFNSEILLESAQH